MKGVSLKGIHLNSEVWSFEVHWKILVQVSSAWLWGSGSPAQVPDPRQKTDLFRKPPAAVKIAKQKDSSQEPKPKTICKKATKRNKETTGVDDGTAVHVIVSDSEEGEGKADDLGDLVAAAKRPGQKQRSKVSKHWIELLDFFNFLYTSDSDSDNLLKLLLHCVLKIQIDDKL